MVDMQALQRMAIGFCAVVVSIAFIVILTTSIGSQADTLGSHAIGVSGNVGCTLGGNSWNATNCSTAVGMLVGNGTAQVGSLITTWGTIIVLGIVIVAIFVGIIAALQYLTNRRGR